MHDFGGCTGGKQPQQSIPNRMRSLNTNQSRKNIWIDSGQQPRSKSTILFFIPTKLRIDHHCLTCGGHDESYWYNHSFIKKTIEIITMNRKQHLLLLAKKIVIIKTNTNLLSCKGWTGLISNRNR